MQRPGEFVNTWSVDGFISEGCQPAELGWGTHEKELPFDGARHAFGTDAAIYLNRPGCVVSDECTAGLLSTALLRCGRHPSR